MGPLNDSAVGIVYLRIFEPDHQAVAINILPFPVLQLLHAASIASVRQKLEVQ